MYEERDLTGLARKRKNTKRWCKGKPGVEHQYVTHNWAEFMGWSIPLNFMSQTTIDVCRVCGKQKYN